MRRRAACGIIPFLVALGGCETRVEEETETPVTADVVAPALETISVDDLLRHTRRLSSDGFEGRAPGTAGEDSTVAYLTEQFRSIGLQPGNPDGGWTQDITLVGIRSRATGRIEAAGQTFDLGFPENFVAVSYRDGSRVQVEESPLVFVGYGVVAPEYGWDDYDGRDMSGKTLVMLVNDPPVPSPTDSAELDPDFFNGRAMTYYGRWTYKYEIGAEKGADAVIIIHETGPAGYPWEVVTGSWGGENFDIASEGGTTPVAVEAWITETMARRLFDATGHTFEDLKQRARTPDFEPVELDATADFTVETERRTVQSRNVIAKVEGGDTALRDEVVVYTAHWDHLGRDTTLQGDPIYNGALDNASGTAGLIELAEAFATLTEPPARSVLFLAVTAEEQGLLGARYYAENPLYPLDRTLANINIDGVNQWGPTEDIVVIGHGSSSLEDVLEKHATDLGRVLAPDPEPEKGFFYRSDHFEFAKQGVPALYTDTGTRFRDRPENWGQQKRDEYTQNDYHKPSDEIKDDWDLSGAVEDLRLLFLVGYDVAQTHDYPTWNEGNEFRARRQEMLDRR